MVSDRMSDEAASLWAEVFGEPPPILSDGRLMLEVILESTPTAIYDRLQRPNLSKTGAPRPPSKP